MKKNPQSSIQHNLQPTIFSSIMKSKNPNHKKTPHRYRILRIHNRIHHKTTKRNINVKSTTNCIKICELEITKILTKGRIWPEVEREDSEEAMSFAADLSALLKAIGNADWIRKPRARKWKSFPTRLPLRSTLILSLFSKPFLLSFFVSTSVYITHFFLLGSFFNI